MDIFVYSDESGVFDKKYEKFFVYAGVILLHPDEIQPFSSRYTAVEKNIHENRRIDGELKAVRLKNREKVRLFNVAKNYHKFAVIISQKRILDTIYKGKKDKQRYLDYAFKIGVKRALQDLINEGVIKQEDVKSIKFFVDEHTTATNGRYELQEAIEQELISGTYNYTWSKFFPPLFTNAESVKVKYCDSCKVTLIRCADIIANTVYYLINANDKKLSDIENLHITFLP